MRERSPAQDFDGHDLQKNSCYKTDAFVKVIYEARKRERIEEKIAESRSFSFR